MNMLVTVLVIGIGLYITDRFCLWLERKGLLFYRKNKPQGGVIGNTFLELQNIVNPSTRHILEIKQNVITSKRCTNDKDAKNDK